MCDNDGAGASENPQETDEIVHVENFEAVDLNSNSANTKESTRTYIAQLYIWAFFIVILLVFIIGFIEDFRVEDYKDMLVTVSGVLSGPLGFIVGYYFKASKE